VLWGGNCVKPSGVLRAVVCLSRWPLGADEAAPWYDLTWFFDLQREDRTDTAKGILTV